MDAARHPTLWRVSTRSESAQIMRRLRDDAARIAERFRLRYREIRAERKDVLGHYGICTQDGHIRIRLRHARSGRLLKYSSLVNTLCHELAHLRHFNHGDEFKRYYFSLLRWARQQGIYRPATTAAAGPGTGENGVTAATETDGTCTDPSGRAAGGGAGALPAHSNTTLRAAGRQLSLFPAAGGSRRPSR